MQGDRRWALVQDNCFSVLRCLPDGVFDHVITDPPYSEHVHSSAVRRVYVAGSTKRSFDFGFDHLSLFTRERAVSEFARLTQRWSIIFSDVEEAHLWRHETLEFVRTCFVVKDKAMPQMSGDRPGSAVEALVLLHPAGRKRWNGGGDSNLFTTSVSFEHVHPAQKELALMLEIVAKFTDPGDVILDAFAGSGTTGVAALRLGRRFVGFERDPRFAEIAIERLTAESQNDGVGAVRAKQERLF